MTIENCKCYEIYKLFKAVRRFLKGSWVCVFHFLCLKWESNQRLRWWSVHGSPTSFAPNITIHYVRFAALKPVNVLLLLIASLSFNVHIWSRVIASRTRRNYNGSLPSPLSFSLWSKTRSYMCRWCIELWHIFIHVWIVQCTDEGCLRAGSSKDYYVTMHKFM